MDARVDEHHEEPHANELLVKVALASTPAAEVDDEGHPRRRHVNGGAGGGTGCVSVVACG